MINIFHDIVRMFPMKSVHIIHVSRYNLVAKVSSFRTIGYGEIYMPNVGIRGNHNGPIQCYPTSLWFKMRLTMGYHFVIT